MKNSSIASSSRAAGEASHRWGARVREGLVGSGSSRAYVWFVLTAMVIALAGVEALLRIYVVPISNTRQNRVHLVYSVKNPDVILGDSHLYQGFINETEFTNLATGGSSPRTLEIVAREYFRFQDPGRVILEASPQLFTSVLQKEGPQGHDDYFVQNIGLPFALYVFEPGIARHVAKLRDISALKKRALVAQGKGVVGRAFDRKVQQTRADYSPEHRRKLAAIRLQQSRPVRQLRESEVFAAYRRLLEFLRDRGARVCMVRTPVDDTFLEMSANDERYQDALRLLEQSARELGFRYVDFQDLPTKLEERHFGNEDHLLAEGSAIFAPAVIEACFPEG